MFSLAGATISKLRCSLDSGTADMLLFVNKNMRHHPEFMKINQVAEVQESAEYLSALTQELDKGLQSSTRTFPSTFRPVTIPEPEEDLASIYEVLNRPSTSTGQPALPTVPGLVKSESESSISSSLSQ